MERETLGFGRTRLIGNFDQLSTSCSLKVSFLSSIHPEMNPAWSPIKARSIQKSGTLFD